MEEIGSPKEPAITCLERKEGVRFVDNDRNNNSQHFPGTLLNALQIFHILVTILQGEFSIYLFSFGLISIPSLQNGFFLIIGVDTFESQPDSLPEIWILSRDTQRWNEIIVASTSGSFWKRRSMSGCYCDFLVSGSSAYPLVLGVIHDSSKTPLLIDYIGQRQFLLLKTDEL